LKTQTVNYDTRIHWYMEELRTQSPEAYEHQLVVSDVGGECDCGIDHEEGDVLWGGSSAPDNIGGSYNPREKVTDIHNVSVEYRKT